MKTPKSKKSTKNICVFILLIVIFVFLTVLLLVQNQPTTQTNVNVDVSQEINRLQELVILQDSLIKHVVYWNIYYLTIAVMLLLATGYFFYVINLKPLLDKINEQEKRLKRSEKKSEKKFKKLQDDHEKKLVELSSEFKKTTKLVEEKLTKDLNEHKGDIVKLRAQLYRSMGQHWDSQGSFMPAVIWWIRSAYESDSISEEKMTRLTLNAAKRSLEQVSRPINLPSEILKEYKELFSKIDSVKYKIEKEALNKKFEEVLKKFPAR